jgi:hypothetical protein
MEPEPLSTRVDRYLGPLIARRGFTVENDEPSNTSMGEQAVLLESEDFRVVVMRDRGGSEWITLGTKVRARPRAPLRDYLVSRLIAYHEQANDPNPRPDLETEAKWLIEHEELAFNPAWLNSEELRVWNANASRLLFGQKPRNR